MCWRLQLSVLEAAAIFARGCSYVCWRLQPFALEAVSCTCWKPQPSMPGAPQSELASLISSKTVTLPLLLQLLPEGTPDPSPFLYNDVFYGIAGCSALALACNVAAFQLPIAARARSVAAAEGRATVSRE